MLGRSPALVGLVALTALLALPGAAALAQAPSLGLRDAALGDPLAGVPAAPTVPAPVPPGALDPAPGGGGRAPSPLAPDLVSPTGSSDAGLFVASLAGVLGLAALVVGGTRFRNEDVLDHELRASIYKHVQANVGASLKDITGALGLSTTNAVWHLRKLEDGGLVRGRKFNGAKVYYPTAGGVQARNLSLAGAALTSGNARGILTFVAEHPGIHQREVARLLAINHGTVRWHLKKLRVAELLEERRLGSVTSYHVTTLGAEALQAQAARSPSPLSAGVAAETALHPAASQA